MSTTTLHLLVRLSSEDRDGFFQANIKFQTPAGPSEVVGTSRDSARALKFALEELQKRTPEIIQYGGLT